MPTASPVVIQAATVDLIPSFRHALDSVAREKCFIEMIEALPLDDLYKHHGALIEMRAPCFFAVEAGEVVGWCDISPMKNPRLAHRSTLGMGLRAGYRGQGLGSRLLSAALAAAENFGLEKVELTVYTSNTAARKLYEKHGFELEGLIRNYRKLEGKSFDCLAMAKQLVQPRVLI